MLGIKLQHHSLSYIPPTFPNFQASSTHSIEVRRESTTSLYLPLPGSSIIKGGLVFYNVR
jgi:hypothetical protein